MRYILLFVLSNMPTSSMNDEKIKQEFYKFLEEKYKKHQLPLPNKNPNNYEEKDNDISPVYKYIIIIISVPIGIMISRCIKYIIIRFFKNLTKK